jgi:hypothetical protein
MIRQLRLAPLVLLVSLPLFAADTGTPARVVTLTIHPGEVTVLHLRPDFESTIHLPEEITSVVLGSPGNFKAEHSEGEPEYVYVKPIKSEPSQSNLLISTRSGQHVSLELINDGSAGGATPVDFLLDYKPVQSFLVSEVTPEPGSTNPDTSVCPARRRDSAKPLRAFGRSYAFCIGAGVPAAATDQHAGLEQVGEQADRDIARGCAAVGEPGSCLLFGAEPHGSRSRNRTAADTDIRPESAEEGKKEEGRQHHRGPTGNPRLSFEHDAAGTGGQGGWCSAVRSAQLQAVL